MSSLEMLSAYYDEKQDRIERCVDQTWSKCGGTITRGEVIDILLEMTLKDLSAIERLPREIIYELMLGMSPSSLKGMCTSNQRLQKLCANPAFRKKYSELWRSQLLKLWSDKWLTTTDKIHYGGREEVDECGDSPCRRRSEESSDDEGDESPSDSENSRDQYYRYVFYSEKVNVLIFTYEGEKDRQLLSIILYFSEEGERVMVDFSRARDPLRFEEAGDFYPKITFNKSKIFLDKPNSSFYPGKDFATFVTLHSLEDIFPTSGERKHGKSIIKQFRVLATSLLNQSEKMQVEKAP